MVMWMIWICTELFTSYNLKSTISITTPSNIPLRHRVGSSRLCSKEKKRKVLKVNFKCGQDLDFIENGSVSDFFLEMQFQGFETTKTMLTFMLFRFHSWGHFPVYWPPDSHYEQMFKQSCRNMWFTSKCFGREHLPG